MPSYVFDIETDSLKPSVVHCLVMKEIETKEVKVFTSKGPRFVDEGIELLNEADFLVGHHVLWFDIPSLEKLYPNKTKIDKQKVIDTLVCSRLFNSWDYSQHGLDEWGKKLDFPKTEFTDFSKLTDEMVEYCINDVELNFKLWEYFKKYIFSEEFKDSLRIEHDTQIMYREMHDNGFAFDKDKALELHSTILGERSRLDQVLLSAFPPKVKFLKEVFPKTTKKGTISLINFKWLENKGTPEENGYQLNAPFCLIEYEEFNPASPKQVIERMWDFGWKPVEKTKGHLKAEREKDHEKLEKFKVYGWKVSEENLDTLPSTAPEEAKILVRWLLLNSRISQLETWLSCYDESDGRIHGEVKHIGTWTHRASHTNPNTGNIVSVVTTEDGETIWGEDGRYGADFRSLWKCTDGYKLIGCDAEGIQLRVLAHYMEDEEFTKALVSGSSKDGTDVHTLNKKKLGEVCKDRKVAKTFIYSWVLGASPTKTAQVLECSVPQAVYAREKFLEGYLGLKYLKEEIIPLDAKLGRFIGFDNRHVLCDSTHLMLAGYLQNGESVIMKWANRIWYNELKKLKIPFKQVNFVHDEFQTEVLDKEGMPQIAAKIQEDSIREAGEILKVKCPMLGKSIIGQNWYETH